METDMDGYISGPAAATYCGFNYDYFLRLLRRGRGPACLKLTPRLFWFREEDLDAWLATRTYMPRHNAVTRRTPYLATKA